MELDKVNSNDQIELYRESREILEKCHSQIREIVVPDKPKTMPDSVVLGPIRNKEHESLASVLGFLGGAVGVMFSGIISGVESASLTASCFAAVSLVSITNGFITLSPTMKSIGYRAQQLWRKMGLPARRLQQLENQIAMETIAFIRTMEANERKIGKINKKVQPELKKINAQSKEFVFNFGINGLVSTRRKIDAIHPSFADLAKEIGI